MEAISGMLGRHKAKICCAVLLLLSGCVSIPASHFIVEQDGYICSVNGECLCENAVLPDRYIDAASQTDGLDPEWIVLLNWNAHKETGLQWLQELQCMISGVDLLTLQEGVLTSDLRDLLSDEYGGGWTLASAFTKSEVHTGVLTASRVQPDFFCSFRVAEPIIVVPKTVLISRYPIAGTTETLLLANMHMVNFSVATKAYREQLRNAFDLINQHQGPLLIAGDFNSWSDERQLIIQHFADALGAESVQFSVDGRKTFFGHVVDHVFYRGLEPIESVALPLTISDHNPMRVTFRLAGDMFWRISDE
ncbi:MAG: endonuclease/exonuclease/phosphatase family protein [Thermodesulfobacteriota bacterium]|nr:endonuclease/exonuclease/phosphatase family protein [Thermodesulfobacteriota bacterium]